MAAWMTIAFVMLLFFILPAAIPRVTDWPTNPSYLTRNQVIETTVTRKAAPSDVARRFASIGVWEQTDAAARPTNAPEPLRIGDNITERKLTGGKSIFWSEGVKPVDDQGAPLDIPMQPVGDPVQLDDDTTQQKLDYADGTRLRGFGNFRVDFLLYKPLLDMTTLSSAMLNTLELPLKIVLPFAVMIVCSLVTPRNSKATLDRYYAKMKTVVDPDPATDQQNLESAYADFSQFEQRKLFPNSEVEIEKPSLFDMGGLIFTITACLGVIGLAVWVASIGS